MNDNENIRSIMEKFQNGEINESDMDAKTKEKVYKLMAEDLKNDIKEMERNIKEQDKVLKSIEKSDSEIEKINNKIEIYKKEIEQYEKEILNDSNGNIKKLKLCIEIMELMIKLLNK